MDSTANYGFVIPSDDGSDLMDADLWRTPVTQVDTKLRQLYDQTKASMDGTGNVMLGNTDIGLVMAANWSLNFFQAALRYGMCSVRLDVTRTTIAYNNTSDGNLTNVNFATWNINSTYGAKIKPILGYGPLSTGHDGVIFGGYAYGTGQFVLASMAPGPGIAIGDKFTCHGTWAVAV